MKPVYQTRFGATTGNCFAACVASLLEISIEEADAVACGTAEGIVEDWHGKSEAWFRERGLHLVAIKWDSSDPSAVAPFSHFAEGALCILTGPSPRHETALHCVVGRYEPIPCDVHIGHNRPRFVVEHDPSPQGGNITKITWIEFLVPFNPARR